MHELLHRPEENRNRAFEPEQQKSVEKNVEEENLMQDQHRQETPFYEKGWRGDNFAYGPNGKEKKGISPNDMGDFEKNTIGATERGNPRADGATPIPCEKKDVPKNFQTVIDATHIWNYYFATSDKEGNGNFYYVESILEDTSMVTIPNKPCNIPTATLVSVNTQMTDITFAAAGIGGIAVSGAFTGPQGTRDANNAIAGPSVIQCRQKQIADIKNAALTSGVTVGGFMINVSFNPAACQTTQGEDYQKAVVNALTNIIPEGNKASNTTNGFPNTIPMTGLMPAFLLGAPAAFLTTVSYIQTQNLPLTWVEQ
jgi:hypothetical protein